jgi:phage terminase large subunit-like protein
MQEQKTVDFRALRERYSQGKKAYEEAMAARYHMPGGRGSHSRRLDQLDDVALEDVPEELSLVCPLLNHLHAITDSHPASPCELQEA